MSDNRCCHCDPCYPTSQPVMETNANGNINANMNTNANMYANAPADANAGMYPHAPADANAGMYAHAPADANAAGNANANADVAAANNNNNSNHFPPRCHVHEVVGSVMMAEERNGPGPFGAEQGKGRCCPHPDPDEAHNHRFATISGPPIPIPGGHVHEIAVRTDFYDDHFHLIIGTSGPAVFVGDRHVHFLSGYTSFSDGHSHAFRAASLIDDPIGD